MDSTFTTRPTGPWYVSASPEGGFLWDSLDPPALLVPVSRVQHQEDVLPPGLGLRWSLDLERPLALVCLSNPSSSLIDSCSVSHGTWHTAVSAQRVLGERPHEGWKE